MSDTTELIQRLRDIGEKTFDDWDSAHEAADALEQQAAQIAEKDAEIAALRATLNFIAKHFSSNWPERCQSNVLAARHALTTSDAALRQEQPAGEGEK